MQTPTPSLDRLYHLLPSVHRLRDGEQGSPLRALLQVISKQVNLVEADIARLYENWFIETCEDWVVPYIGDLIGTENVATNDIPFLEHCDPGAQGINRLGHRREVGNTIRRRRRKGTLAQLEVLALEVGGWPARVVEFGRLAAQTQSTVFRHEKRGLTTDLRGKALDQAGTAFDDSARTVDIRRINSSRTIGTRGLAEIGVFIWRLRNYPVTGAPACCLEDIGPHCFSFSALGNDIPLFVNPRVKSNPGSITSPLNVPGRITRREFSEAREMDGRRETRASEQYYGLDKSAGPKQVRSLAIWADGWPDKNQNGQEPIPLSRIIPADLGDWSYRPPKDHVAVDPVRGRMAFHPRQLPKKGVSVSYHYGFGADLGGGEYGRPLSRAAKSRIIRVSGQDALRKALEPWIEITGNDGTESAPESQPKHAVIEITDSGVYVLPIRIFLGEDCSLQIRAGQRNRPVIRLLDWQTDHPDNLTVSGLRGSRFTLDGLLISGRGVQIEGELKSFTVRHCTLVPGWSLACNCEPMRPAEPSIEMIDTGACLVIERSIVGSIQVNVSESSREPIRIRISDSILDAAGSGRDQCHRDALGAAGSLVAHASLQILRSTVIGRIATHAIVKGENTIFFGRVTVARRQTGCLRFCYAAPGSRTPRRFHCQPDLAVCDCRTDYALADPKALAAAIRTAQNRVRPHFAETRYGKPEYCRMADDSPPEIFRGADDQSEMGVYHDQFEPQKLDSLKIRLDEYTTASADVGVILST